MTNELNDDTVDIDLIERYYRGLLDDTELQDFRKRENDDKDFADKVKAYTEILGGLEYYVNQKDFADTLQEWEREIKEQPKKKHVDVVPLYRKNAFWLAAAAVAGLVVVSAVFLFRSTPPDPVALYEGYYQPYPNVFDPTVRGDADTVSLTRKAFQAYNAEDYTTAATCFRELMATGDEIEKDNARLYLGNCYLSLDSAAAARDILTEIDEQSHVANQAKWYLALAYLKLRDPERAREVLIELKDQPNSYQHKANQLLQEIHN